MPKYVKHGGVWREVSPYVKEGGVWREVDSSYVKEGGVWRNYHTASVYVPRNAGEYMHGGYYAGGNIIVDGVEYAIIVAPKEYGQSPERLQYKLNNNEDDIPISRHDGKKNAEQFVNNWWPAGNYCNNLRISGYSDWHLPSRNELEVCYRYLKPRTTNNFTGVGIHGTNPNSNPRSDEEYTEDNPPQTSSELFIEGGEQSFTEPGSTVRFWTSSQPSSMPDRVWFQFFSNGRQTTQEKNYSYDVRAVRWEEVE